MPASHRNRHRWSAAALVLSLWLPAADWAAAAPPVPVVEREVFVRDQASARAEKLRDLHEALGIRPDQAALWKQVEQRMSSQDARMVDLQYQSQSHRMGRLLDDLELQSRWQVAQAADQRVTMETLRWLSPRLDAKQRKVLGDLEGKDSPLPPANRQSDQQLDDERAAWLTRRAALKQSLKLRPEQAAAWKTFEAETADPFERSRAVLTASRTAKPPMGMLDMMTRMQEAIPTDTANWLAALRRLDRSLDKAQRARLDAFVRMHPSPMQ